MQKERMGRIIVTEYVSLDGVIEAPGGEYRLTPYDPAFEKKMKKADAIMSRYRNTLNALSK